MSAAPDYDPHSPFIEYVEHGWRLCPIQYGTKRPGLDDWNREENAITDPIQAGRLAGAGLCHAYSGTCAVDIDDYTAAKDWLAGHGVNIDALLGAEDAVQIRSGRDNRAKLIYALADPLPSCVFKVKDPDTGKERVLFELRCASAGGLTLQDVLPPSIHPDTGHPYAWGGAGDWSDLSPLPDALRAIWRARLASAGTGQPARAGGAGAGAITLSPDQVRDLRSALFSMRADDYHDWVRMGHALWRCGDLGRGLWMDWSATSDKFDAGQAARKWETFDGTTTDYRAVFAEAQKAGWVNPQARQVAYLPAADGPVHPPLLVPAGMTVPELPATLLPGVLGEMAAAVSKHTQTPPAAAVLMELGVLATCCQRRWEVEVKPGYREPVSLWPMATLPSGARKSAVMDPITRPLSLFERDERTRLQGDVARNQAQRAVAEKRIKKLKENAATATPDERKKIEQEIEAELLAMPPEIRMPRLFTSDATVETVQQLLVDHAGRIAVISDEGGVFQIMAGAYSGGMASVDAYLQGYSGSPLRVDRGSRSAHVDRPAVSFVLAIQPLIMAEAGRNKRFRHSGLMGRFLYAMPENTVGRRDVRRSDPIPDTVRSAYEGLIRRLLSDRQAEQADKPADVLSLTPDALDLWHDFMAELEARHGAGRELEHITEWTSKLGGNVARIAALLHLADGPDTTLVGVEYMSMAVELGRLLIQHALAAFELMGLTASEEDAHVVLRWVKAQRQPDFTVRDAYRALRAHFPKVDRLKDAITQLESWNVVVHREKQKPEHGGRPVEQCRINPRLWQ